MKYYFFNDWHISDNGYGDAKITLDLENGAYVRFEVPKNVEAFFFLGNYTYRPTIEILSIMTYVQRSDVLYG